MRFTRIIGTGHYLPDRKVDNSELYNIIGEKDSAWDVERARESLKKSKSDVTELSPEEVFHEYYMQVTGVGSRHFASEKETVEYMAAEAAKQALSGLEKPELVIVPTFTSEFVKEMKKIPNSGLLIAHEIGNDKVPAFSMNSSDMNLSRRIPFSFVQSGKYKNILCVTRYPRSPQGTHVELLVGEEHRERLADDNSLEAVVKGANALLDNMSLKPEDLELVIYSGLVNENPGSLVAKQLGGSNGLSINTACSGFAYGCAVADSLIRTERYKDIVVAAAEKMSSVVDFQDYKTLALFGDGAGAARLTATDDKDKAIKFVIGSQYSESDITLCGSGDKLKMTGGTRVVARAVRSMENVTMKLLSQGVTSEELNKVALIIPHDANQRINDALAKDFEEGFRFSKDMFYTRIRSEGNCSGSSVAKNLDFARREGRIKEKDVVLMPTVGGGYAYGALKLVF